MSYMSSAPKPNIYSKFHSPTIIGAQILLKGVSFLLCLIHILTRCSITIDKTYSQYQPAAGNILPGEDIL